MGYVHKANITLKIETKEPVTFMATLEMKWDKFSTSKVLTCDYEGVKYVIDIDDMQPQKSLISRYHTLRVFTPDRACKKCGVEIGAGGGFTRDGKTYFCQKCGQDEFTWAGYSRL